MLFRSPGVPPDNDTWISRKVRTVFRYGVSTWQMHWTFGGDENAFRAKNGFAEQEAGQYAIWGGGVPIRVHGVEGIVAVVAISGLPHEDDHAAVVEVLTEYAKNLQA